MTAPGPSETPTSFYLRSKDNGENGKKRMILPPKVEACKGKPEKWRLEQEAEGTKGKRKEKGERKKREGTGRGRETEGDKKERPTGNLGRSLI